jgi:hypothetical protein
MSLPNVGGALRRAALQGLGWSLVTAAVTLLVIGGAHYFLGA